MNGMMNNDLKISNKQNTLLLKLIEHDLRGPPRVYSKNQAKSTAQIAKAAVEIYSLPCKSIIMVSV